ncbi:hypothetical protein FJZ21_02990 [Candidatus Pacearchaeota archaeon]|nr:hypothetical protein [Candidatus Pacearchaeota archaeon]
MLFVFLKTRKESTKEAYENCPVKINLSDRIKRLRVALVEKGIGPDSAKEMMKNVKQYSNLFGKFEEGKTPDKLYCC